MEPTQYFGIDFSLTCPAICRFSGKAWSLDSCSFLFLSGNKKLSCSWFDGKIEGQLFRPFSTDTERFLNNASMIKNWIRPNAATQIAIEGYSFGSRGSRLFQIGEATGVLKTLLIHDMKGALIADGQNLQPFAPSAIKKFATGKGNADKVMMVEAFQQETGIDLVKVFGMKKLGSPVHDLVDSYYIAKKLHSDSQTNPK